jgi:hypothetical protein
MTREKINPDGEHAFRLRVPLDLYQAMQESARENGRSVNAEMVRALRHYLHMPATPKRKKPKGGADA